MNITNTLVFKTTSIDDAITSAITELYVPSYASKCLELLVISGNVGTIIKDSEYASTTNYYIASVISPELIRVEICSTSVGKHE